MNIENSIEESLKVLSENVFYTMKDIGFIEHVPALKCVKLGFLRRDATIRHGVTRYSRMKGVKVPHDVKCVDLHRELINERWNEYAELVLYHEFLHCIGHMKHNSEFKNLESKWPRYEIITEWLRDKQAKWHWVCKGCDIKHARKKKSNGRYICATCNNRLTDVQVIR